MANITRWDPFEDIDDLFRGVFLRPMRLESQEGAQGMRLKMDVKEDEKAFTVHAEVPGVKKEDIHVTIDGNLVSLSAEVKQEKEVKDGERVLRAERYYGKVSRSFQVAQDIDDGKAAAKFNDGVLELTLPKRAASASKRLAID